MEFNNYKKKTEEVQKAAQAEAERKIAAYKQEVDSMRTKLEAFQKAIDKLIANAEQQKQSHEKELGDYVKQQNQKYIESV